MRPLELTIYPFQTERYPSGYRIERDGYITRHGATRRAESKHLTDTELAAEYWHRTAHFNKQQWVEEVLIQQGEPAWSDEKWAAIAAPLNTLHRFATAPHYYEEQE